MHSNTNGESSKLRKVSFESCCRKINFGKVNIPEFTACFRKFRAFEGDCYKTEHWSWMELSSSSIIQYWSHNDRPTHRRASSSTGHTMTGRLDRVKECVTDWPAVGAGARKVSIDRLAERDSKRHSFWCKDADTRQRVKAVWCAERQRSVERSLTQALNTSRTLQPATSATTADAVQCTERCVRWASGGSWILCHVQRHSPYLTLPNGKGMLLPSAKASRHSHISQLLINYALAKYQ